MSARFPKLGHGLADHVFSDIETEALEVREYAVSTEHFTPSQVDQLVQKWREMSSRERALALSNMREQKRRHTERVERVMASVKAAQEAITSVHDPKE